MRITVLRAGIALGVFAASMWLMSGMLRAGDPPARGTTAPAATVSDMPNTAATSTAPLSPEAARIEAGRYIAVVGNCTSCHSRVDGDPFSGGVAFKTDFGTIYSTNITPDRTAGIGGWTEAQFIRAMREGLDDEGKHLYPAFPYTAFTKLSDGDLRNLYAYVKTLAPSTYQGPENDLRFPYNQRWLLGIWNWLYLDVKRFQPQPERGVAWNRGAYLVDGPGHCSSCHTPRNFLGAEKRDKYLSGGIYNDKVTGGDVRPWAAVNLTQADSGLKAWTLGDLTSYLKTGHGQRAGSLGPMNEVIGNSLQHLTDADIQAIAAYVKSLPAIETSDKQSPSAAERSGNETQYTIHCGTCHLPTGLGSAPGAELGPPLVGNAIVQASSPASLINVILNTSEVLTPAPAAGWKNMEGLGDKIDDDQVAAIANYLRSNWGNRGGKVTAADVAKQR
jgi:mono/diheme cytochrome c family protein